MNDKGLIIAGIGIFLVLVTMPIWYTLGAGGSAAPPDLEMPDRSDLSLFPTDDDYHCIEETNWMRANHMRLLDDWRNRVVRDGESEHVSDWTGKTHQMSLTKTCMKCHTNRETFCYRCHEHAHVESLHCIQGNGPEDPPGVRCWSCHQEPKIEPKGN